MKVIFPNCAGIDVHKKFVVACRVRMRRGKPEYKTRTFSTMRDDLQVLAAWLAEWGCTHVAMESTGVYWQPVFNVLEGQLQVWLVNARHAKAVPARKTDVHDAEWLAQLLQHGLLRPSYIPDREQRDLRDLVRYRQTLVEDRNRIANRIQKVLEDANIKLAAVVTDIQGISAQAILHALLAGVTDPHQLAELAQGKLQRKQADLERALAGTLRAHHRFMLAELLDHLTLLTGKIERVEQQIQDVLASLPKAFAEAVERLDTIPGVDMQTAILIVAEIGVDMRRFPSAKHLSAWAGMAPGNNESGGKRRAARTRNGNRFLRRGLVQAAYPAARKKESYLKALFYRLSARRGRKRAAVAVGRTILEIAYYLIDRGTTYEELGATYFDQLDRERATKRLVGRLRALGFSVNLQEVVEGQPA
jgi:transposase